MRMKSSATLNFHHIFFFGDKDLVDFGNILVGDFLDIFLRTPVLILGYLFLLE
jgi:hypothetical protein